MTPAMPRSIITKRLPFLIAVLALQISTALPGAYALDATSDQRTTPSPAFTNEPNRDGDIITANPANVLHIEKFDTSKHQLRFQITFPSNSGSCFVALEPTNLEELDKGPTAAAAEITSNGKRGGLSVRGNVATFNKEQGTLVLSRISYRNYWPHKAGIQKSLLTAGHAKPRVEDRWFDVRVEAQNKRELRVWIDDQLIASSPINTLKTEQQLAIQFSKSIKLQKINLIEAANDDSIFQPVSLDAIAHAQSKNAIGRDNVAVDNVPFTLVQQGKRYVDVSTATWPSLQADPASYYEPYDTGARYEGDPERLIAHAPRDDYIAAHILAVSNDDSNSWPGVTLQCGEFADRGGRGHMVLRRFSYDIPRSSDASATPGETLDIPDGRLFSIRIPMHRAFAQDLQGSSLDLELTKQIRLAIRSPDPARYRYRPLGLPSAARIWALTLERSPLQMRVTTDEPGNAFEQPSRPVFAVHLTNITDVPQAFTIQTESMHLDGKKKHTSDSDVIPPGQSRSLQIELPYSRLGYHTLSVKLLDKEQNLLLHRPTSFAMLPKDTREHVATSPLGTWDFSGAHATIDDPAFLGELYRKAGLRYGMFGIALESRLQWGVRQGREPRVHRKDAADYYAKWIQDNPDATGAALLLHESSISSNHVQRAPQMFTDHEHYQYSEKEQKRFDKIWHQVIDGATSMRSNHPDTHLRLGNGPLPTKEAFLQRGIPAELFDSLGNESAVFGRPPEAQPPDWVGNNAGIWMDRLMLEHYGYSEATVTQCYETCYPSTNPGNLSLRTQSDFLVRHFLHAMTWKLDPIRYGVMMDTGNSYYYSNWGAGGLCFQMPEANVKPAFVAVATMSRLLDGATYEGELSFDSPSLFGLRFKRPNGTTVYALWTPQGRREITVSNLSKTDWIVTDSQGNSESPKVMDGSFRVSLASSVIYVSGNGTLEVTNVGQPDHSDSHPDSLTRTVAELTNPEPWHFSAQRDLELELHNGITPRRLGDFQMKHLDAWEGRKHVIAITPNPIKHGTQYMPMYGSLEHARGIPLPEKPTEIGVWVNGNSSWGRVIFELTDAGGERFISIGAARTGGASPWMLDWMPEEMAAQEDKLSQADWNTNDVFGLSRIDFDGWRLLRFPLPGQYHGEGYHWPYNSQWKHSDDGIVEYPLTLRRLVIELPENTLHLQTFAPVSNKTIYLSDIVTRHGDTKWIAPAGPAFDRSEHSAR